MFKKKSKQKSKYSRRLSMNTVERQNYPIPPHFRQMSQQAQFNLLPPNFQTYFGQNQEWPQMNQFNSFPLNFMPQQSFQQIPQQQPPTFDPSRVKGFLYPAQYSQGLPNAYYKIGYMPHLTQNPMVSSFGQEQNSERNQVPQQLEEMQPSPQNQSQQQVQENQQPMPVMSNVNQPVQEQQWANSEIVSVSSTRSNPMREAKRMGSLNQNELEKKQRLAQQQAATPARNKPRKSDPPPPVEEPFNPQIADKKEKYKCIYVKENDVDENIICDVCLDDLVTENEDELVICDLCNAATHQGCYGNGLEKAVPSGDWYCQRCICLKNNPMMDPHIIRCYFCKDLKGMMIWDQNLRWVHITCVNWNTDVFFSSEEKNKIEGQVNMERFKLSCSICKQKDSGYCMQCDYKNCVISYHVRCAMKEGLISSWDVMNQQRVKEEDAECYIFCRIHNEIGKRELQKGGKNRIKPTSENAQISKKVKQFGMDSSTILRKRRRGKQQKSDENIAKQAEVDEELDYVDPEEVIDENVDEEEEDLHKEQKKRRTRSSRQKTTKRRKGDIFILQNPPSGMQEPNQNQIFNAMQQQMFMVNQAMFNQNNPTGNMMPQNFEVNIGADLAEKPRPSRRATKSKNIFVPELWQLLEQGITPLPLPNMYRPNSQMPPQYSQSLQVNNTFTSQEYQQMQNKPQNYHQQMQNQPQNYQMSKPAGNVSSSSVFTPSDQALEDCLGKMYRVDEQFAILVTLPNQASRRDIQTAFIKFVIEQNMVDPETHKYQIHKNSFLRDRMQVDEIPANELFQYLKMFLTEV